MQCNRSRDCVGKWENGNWESGIVWEGGRMGGDFEEVARLRLDSVCASGGKQSMLRRKMGRKSRSAQRGGVGRRGGGPLAIESVPIWILNMQNKFMSGQR